MNGRGLSLSAPVAQGGSAAALLTACLGSYLVTVAFTPVSTILPGIARGLDVEVTDAGWILTSYLVALTGFLLVSGRIGDIYGHRRVFTVGLAIYALAAAGAGVSQTLLQLIMVRTLQGLGAALIFGNALALVTAAVSERERGRAVGLVLMSSSLGALTGAALAVLAVELISWRLVFLMTAPPAAMGIAVALRLRDNLHTQRSGLDLLGALLLFLTLATLSLSLTHAHGGPETFAGGWRWHLPMQLLTLGLLGAFIWVERRAANPILPGRLLRRPVFTLTIAANLILHMTMMAAFFLMPVLIEQGLELAPIYTAGLAIGIVSFGVVLAPVSGWLYDRTRWPYFPPLGMLLITTGFFSLGLMDTGSSYILIWALGALNGVGAGLFLTVNNTTAMSALEPSERGFASGMVATTTQMGHTLAISLAGVILATALGAGAEHGAVSAAYIGGFQRTVLAMGVVSSLGVLLALAAARLSVRPSPTAPLPARASSSVASARALLARSHGGVESPAARLEG